MGDFVAAEQHYENALEIIDAIQDSDFAMLHRSIIYCAKGDLKVHEVFDEKPTPHMLCAARKHERGGWSGPCIWISYDRH